MRSARTVPRGGALVPVALALVLLCSLVALLLFARPPAASRPRAVIDELDALTNLEEAGLEAEAWVVPRGAAWPDEGEAGVCAPPDVRLRKEEPAAGPSLLDRCEERFSEVDDATGEVRLSAQLCQSAVWTAARHAAPGRVTLTSATEERTAEERWSLPADASFAAVSCSAPAPAAGIEHLVEYYARVTPRDVSEAVRTRPRPRPAEHFPDGARPVSVLALGFDSMSRPMMHRHMPRTVALLRRLGAFEFLRMAVVGDGTRENLVPLLTGRRAAAVAGGDDAADDETLPWLWNAFADAGYLTLFGEDRPEWSAFGFGAPPADFCAAPLFAMPGFDAHEAQRCGAGPVRPTHRHLVRFAESGARAARQAGRPIFSFVFSGVAHNEWGALAAADRDVERALLRADLDNTAVFLFGDHGPRFGAYRESPRGAVEERAPAACLLLPRRVLERSSEAAAALRVNQRRLVTPFDVHATLLLLLWPLGGRGGAKAGAGRRRPSRRCAAAGPDPWCVPAPAVPLFEEVPRGRTCAGAGVPEHWCLCSAASPAAPGEGEEAAAALVRHVNGALLAGTPCAPLELGRVVRAERRLPSTSVVGRRTRPEADGEMVKDAAQERRWARVPVRVVVAAAKGRGVFEATVSGAGRVEGLSRLDAYGARPPCSPRHGLDPFCGACL